MSCSADELISRALRYRSYWGEAGGITVSGGEPLLQIDFVLELFQKAKEKGIHTVLDTSGNPFTRKAPFFDAFVPGIPAKPRSADERLERGTRILLFGG